MKEKTNIANVIEKTEGNSQYDQQVKELLSDKNILAHILKGCVDECSRLSIEEIKDCITGEVAIDSSRIEGHQQEDNIIGEGTIKYDIRFDIILPSKDCAKIIIDIEAQKNDTSYDLVTRGIFYIARMLSSQLKNEFEINKAKSYDDLKKVYSIWICMNPPAKDEDSITKYSFKQEDVFGTYKGNARFDMATLIMIRLSNKGTESKNSLIGMLSTLLSDNLKSAEKEEKLENDYGIQMTTELKGKVIKMCNLSEIIEEKGIEKGIILMAKKNYARGLDSNIIIQDIMEELEISNDEARIIFNNKVVN